MHLVWLFSFVNLKKYFINVAFAICVLGFAFLLLASIARRCCTKLLDLSSKLDFAKSLTSALVSRLDILSCIGLPWGVANPWVGFILVLGL